MTEIQVEQEKFYISAIVDLFNREVIALKVSSSPNQELIKATIEAAQKNRKLGSLEECSSTVIKAVCTDRLIIIS